VNSRAPVFFLALVAGVVGMIGTFGAWVSVAGVHPKGFDANAGKSVFFGVLIALLLLALATYRRARWPAIVALIPAGIAGAIAGWYFASPSKFVSVHGLFAVSRSWGLYLSAIGAVVLFLLCVVHMILPKQQVATPASPPPAPTPPPPASTSPPPASAP
jgi:hypothetical protein